MPKRAAAASRTLFVLLGSMIAMLAISFDLYLPALPRMGAELGADPAAVQWTLSSFFVGLAIGQLLYGPVSDRLGRRPPLFFGMALFTAASLGCAFAPNIESLIALRFLQALGASAAATVARAVVGDLFELREGARFMSQLVLIQGMAPIFAPYAGGWIVVTAGWRTVFVALAGYCAMVSAAAFFRLPETRSQEAAHAIRAETTQASYLAVLRNGPLMRAAAIGALTSSALFAYISYAPHLLINTFGIPTEQFGLYFGANAVGLVCGAQINRALLGRMQPHEILDRSTIVIFALAVVLLLGARFPVLGMWSVLIPLFLLISTFPIVAPNAMAIALWADRLRTGAVAAVTGSLAFTAGAAASALSGAFYDGTAVPMAMVIAAAAGAALLLRRLSHKDKPPLH